jgi:hypothetical protein
VLCVLFVAGLAAVLLLAPVPIFVRARYHQKPLGVEVEYQALRIVKGRFAFDERRLGPYRKRLSEFDWRMLLSPSGRKKVAESLEGLRRMPEHFRVRAGPEYRRDVFYAVLRSTYIERLRALASIGSPDAARTGYLAGIAWATAGLVQWVCRDYLNIARTEPRFAIRPDFNSDSIQASVEAKLRVRAAPVLVAIIRSRLGRRGAVRHNQRYVKAN